MDNVRKETHVVFSHDRLAQGDVCTVVRDDRGRSSSPTPNSKAKTDGEGKLLQKTSGSRDESTSDKRSDDSVPLLQIKRHVNFSIRHVCQNYKSKTGFKLCRRTCFDSDTLRLTGKAQQKIEEKVV